MELVKLGTILHMEKGKKPLHQIEGFEDGYVPYVDIKAFEQGIISSYATAEKAVTCNEGDLLIVCDGSRSGLTGKAINGVVGSTLSKIWADGLTTDYLRYFIQSQYTFLNTKKKGTGTPHLNANLLKEAKLVVPPIEDQKRIVAKIDELFSNLDASVSELKSAKEKLRVYRQAVLKEAFEGSLTAKWRKHKKIPFNYNTVTIKDIIKKEKNALKAGPFGSSLKKECYVKKGFKVYGQEQVIAGNENIGNYYISKEKYNELSTCKIAPGDILISLVGTVGKVLILSENCEDGIINPRLIKVSLDNKIMLPKYFKYYFECDYLKSLYKIKAHGATMDVLNLSIIKELPFVVCNILEQKQALNEIESRLTVCSSIEKSIDYALQQSIALRQSILKKAFEGRL